MGRAEYLQLIPIHLNGTWPLNCDLLIWFVKENEKENLQDIFHSLVEMYTDDWSPPFWKS